MNTYAIICDKITMACDKHGNRLDQKVRSIFNLQREFQTIMDSTKKEDNLE